MAYCPSCGAATNPGATFCHACGATLAAPPAPAPAPGAMPAAPPAHASPAAAGAGARPVGVSIIGFVMIVAGAFAVLAGLFVLLFMGTLGAFVGSFVPGDSGAFAGFFGMLGVIAAFFVFAFAALAIAMGLGSLKGAAWAWAGTIVVMGLYAIGGLMSLASRDFGGVVTLAVSGLVIWYYFQPDVKRWFGRA